MEDLIASLDYLMPWVILALGVLVTILVSVIRVNTKRPAQVFSILTLSATLFFSLFCYEVPEVPVTIFRGAFEVSSLSLMALCLFSGLGILFCLGNSRYLTKENIHLSDYYHLFLLVILGASVMVAAKDLVIIFIALEVMSLPLYTLAGIRRNDPRSNEAAIKYFILGGALGAVFLLGASFVFGASGSTQLNVIYTWSQTAYGDHSLFGVGHILMIVAFLFKVAAVPFHFWKPDVYEGSPTAVTGIMATIVSAAGFMTLSRVVNLPDLGLNAWWSYAVQLKSFLRIVAAASLILGTAVLVKQTNLKRMLAYSAISHTGYLLLGLLSALTEPSMIYSVWIYLLGYSVMTTGLFLLVGQSEPVADRGTDLVDLTGLFKKSPSDTLLWTIFLFSMAGMPLTIGFFSKYFVFLSAMTAGEIWVSIVAGLCAIVAAYAYLRPIALMVMRDADPSAATWKTSIMGRATVILAATLVLGLGLAPNMMIQVLKGMNFSH